MGLEHNFIWIFTINEISEKRILLILQKMNNPSKHKERMLLYHSFFSTHFTINVQYQRNFWPIKTEMVVVMIG